MVCLRAVDSWSQAAHVWSSLYLSWQSRGLVIVTSKLPKFFIYSTGPVAMPAWRVGVSLAGDKKGTHFHWLPWPPTGDLEECSQQGVWGGGKKGSSPQSLWHLALWAGPGVERGAGMLPARLPPPPTCWHVVLFSWSQAVGGGISVKEPGNKAPFVWPGVCQLPGPKIVGQTRLTYRLTIQGHCL